MSLHVMTVCISAGDMAGGEIRLIAFATSRIPQSAGLEAGCRGEVGFESGPDCTAV